MFDIADAILQIEAYYAPLVAARGAKDLEGNPRCPVDKPCTPFQPEFLSIINASCAAWSAVMVHDFYGSWAPYMLASMPMLEVDVEPIVDKKDAQPLHQRAGLQW